MASEVISKALQEIKTIVGAHDVLSKKKDMLTYRYAATTSGPPPMAVIFPKSTEEVSQVLKVLHKYKVPVIARGAGTNLNGGTVISKEGVVLELAKMHRILEVDLQNRHVLVEAGVTNLEVQQAIEPHGFMFAPDPASQQVSTMGGNIAENAGGPRCVKYGVTVNHVLGLEVALSDGRVLILNGPLEGLPGYDFTGIMHASEGTFGIITKAWLRIMPKPQAIKTMMAIFDTLEDAARTVSQIIAQGIIPATLELIDHPILKAVEQTVKIGYPLDAEAVLLIEVDGHAESLDSQALKIVAICKENNVRETKVAQTERERELLWSGRRGAVGSIARLKPSFAEEDITIPRTKLPEMLKTIAKIGEKYSLIIGNVFHAGDGNFHPVVLYDSRDPQESQRVIEANFEIMKEAAKLGGTVSGEHGIGMEKLKGMPLIFSCEDMSFMRRLKLAFDPQDILNPGKVIPEDVCKETAAALDRVGQTLKESADTDTDTDRSRFLEQLKILIDDSRVCFDKGIFDKYTIGGKTPWCCVKPQDPAEMAAVVKLANEYSIALVPWGNGTKQAIGAPPDKYDVVTLTGDLDRIIEIDVGNLTATVEAGVSLQKLQQSLHEQNLLLPIDPLEAGNPTLGGLVAANSTGGLRLQYKTLKDMVLGFEMISPQGELIKYGGKNLKNVAGYDLCKLLVGSWGTMGILTKVTLKLFPFSEKAVYRVYGTEDFGAFKKYLLDIQNSKLELSTFDVLVKDFSYYVNLCLSGPKESVDKQINLLNTLSENKMKLITEQDDKLLGSGRDFILKAFPRGLFSPDNTLIKSCLLFASISDFIEQILEHNKPGDVTIYAHAANGIIYAVYHGQGCAEVIDKFRKIADEFSQGNPWGVHILGTGAGYTGRAGGESPPDQNTDLLTGLTVSIKKMLDPNNVLNPGRTAGGIII
ncbi:MAG: FAD-binding protein [Bacillota bacterium]